MSIPYIPVRQTPVNGAGTPYASATRTFYRAGTTTLLNAYADNARTTPLANPQVADSAGRFTAAYLDPTYDYRVVLKDAAGNTLADDDYVPSSMPVTAASIGAALYPKTAAETSAGVTPSNYTYPPGDIRRYGGDPTGVSDSTTAIQSAFLVVQAAGNGTVDLGSGSYLVCTNGAVTLATLSSVTGLRVKSSGAKITINRSFTVNQVYQLFQLSACSNVVFEPLTVTAINAPTGTAKYDRGYEVLKLLQGCSNIHADLEVSNCRAAVMARRETSDPASYSSRNLHFNLKVSESGYGLSCILAGDDITANIQTSGIVRSYYPYGVNNHKIRVVSKNAEGNSDCLLSTASGYGLNDIDLTYIDTESTQTDNSLKGVCISFGDQTPGVIRNIKLRINVNLAGTYYRATPLQIEKLNNSGTADTSDRGHKLEGLDVDLNLKAGTGSQPSLRLFNIGTWGTGEYVSNVKLRFRSDGAGQPEIKLYSIQDVALIENSYSSAQVNLYGNTTGRVMVINSTASAWDTTGNVFFSGGDMVGSATYDPASLNDGAGATTTVTVTGAALGDFASASFSLDLQGITLTAWVSAANTVSVRFQNESGGTLDLGSGTLRVRVSKN